jgi:hypothetical protein
MNLASLPRRVLLAALIVPLMLGAAACDERPAKTGPVLLVGDSLSWQAKSYVSFMGQASGTPIDVKAMGGTAPCDWVSTIRTALKATPKPRALVLEFWGNNLTPCMGAARTGIAGYQVGSVAYFSKYRESFNAINSAARDAGVPVMWATSPPRHRTDIQPDLNDTFEGMAKRRGWKIIDAGSEVADDWGNWTRKLPCASIDVTNGDCESGLVEVRAADLVHFSTDPDGGHPGAIRWAGAIVKAIG